MPPFSIYLPRAAALRDLRARIARLEAAAPQAPTPLPGPPVSRI